MLPPSSPELLVHCLRTRTLALCGSDLRSLAATCRLLRGSTARPTERYLFETLLPRRASKRKRTLRGYVLERCNLAEIAQFLRYHGLASERYWVRKYPRVAARLWIACN